MSAPNKVIARALPGFGGRRRGDSCRQLGVGLELRLLFSEVVIGLRLLEGGLAVLPDHHERRQEDRLERDHQRQRWPWAALEREHPDREQDSVDVDELHRAGKRSDLVGDAELGVGGAALDLLEDDWGVRNVRVELLHVVVSLQVPPAQPAGCRDATVAIGRTAGSEPSEQRA